MPRYCVIDTETSGLPLYAKKGEPPPVADVLAIYSEYVGNGWIVVCHNSIFDLKIMRGELRRAGMPDLFAETLNVCTQADFIDVFKCPPTGKQMASGRYAFKQPKLIEAYRHFHDSDFDGAHTSMADARATLAVFRKLIEIGIPIEPKIRYSKSHASALRDAINLSKEQRSE